MSTSLHVLSGAVSERRSAAVRLPGGRRATDNFQVRFLADGRPAGDEGIWAELLDADLELVDKLIAAQVHVEASFNSGHMRVFFETTILARRHAFLRGQRILMSWPAQVRVTERRRAERERVPEEVEVTARLRLDESGRVEMPLYVWDLSATGASFLCPPGKRPPKLSAGQPLNICLRFWNTDHELRVLHRHTQTLPGGRVRLGVEFAAAEGAEPSAPPALHQLIEELKTRRIRSSLGNALGGRSVA